MGVYNTIDNALVKGAGEAVKAWNWTTGETRVGLANKLLAIAPIGEAIAFAVWHNSFSGAVIGSLALRHSHVVQKSNKKLDELDMSAKGKKALSYEAEHLKIINKEGGYYWGFGAIGGTAVSSVEGMQYGALFFSAGQAVRASSHFVMRADDLPPREHCVRRGLDKLKELVEEYRPSPAIVPALVGRTDF